MKPFQLKQHMVNAHPQMKDRDRSFFECKLSSLKRQKLDETGTYQQTNNNIVHASYFIALQVARTKKAHTIGETLVKPCILESVRLVIGETESKKMKQISLSNDTIKKRIDEMSDNIKGQVVSKIKSSPFFVLQLDESTDVANIAEPLVFCRYISSQGIEQDFLFCRPLKTTTKGADIMEVLNDFFQDTGISWTKLVGICTDGAPAMLGSRSGFVALVKQKNPAVEGTHCMIHREALVSKTIPKDLHNNLVVIIKIVNYVKGSALNTRLFRSLCEDMDANHSSLLFHTQVRWLSKGNMLARVYELRDEVKLFLANGDKKEMLSSFNKEGFEARLAYLADIFEALNELNKKLQGRRSNVIFHTDVISAFMAKLQLWGKRLSNGNLASFQRLSDLHGEDDISDQLKAEIIDHLEHLGNEFKRYFPGIDTSCITMSLARNPFMCLVDDVPNELQEEFVELIHDSSMKDEFLVLDLEDFWINTQRAYPRLSMNALKCV